MRLHVAAALAVLAAFSPSLAVAQATSYTYDARGRVVTVTHPSGAKTGYGYDTANNRTTAQVALNGVLTPPNTPPTCYNFTVFQNIPTYAGAVTTTFQASTFISACTDPNGDTLTVTSPAMPLSVTLVAHQSYSVTYTVSDGKGGTASATFTTYRP